MMRSSIFAVILCLLMPVNGNADSSWSTYLTHPQSWFWVGATFITGCSIGYLFGCRSANKKINILTQSHNELNEKYTIQTAELNNLQMGYAELESKNTHLEERIQSHETTVTELVQKYKQKKKRINDLVQRLQGVRTVGETGKRIINNLDIFINLLHMRVPVFRPTTSFNKDEEFIVGYFGYRPDKNYDGSYGACPQFCHYKADVTDFKAAIESCQGVVEGLANSPRVVMRPPDSRSTLHRIGSFVWSNLSFRRGTVSSSSLASPAQ